MFIPMVIKRILATIGLMLIDIELFNDKIKGKLQDVIDDEKDYENARILKTEAKETKKSLNDEKQVIIDDASVSFYSIEKFILKKFDSEIYLSYFNNEPVSKHLKDVKAVDNFIYFLFNKNKPEIIAYIEELKTIKVRCEEYLEKEKEFIEIKEEKFIDSDEKFEKLEKSYKLLRLEIESESLVNEKIEYRKYFPVIKNDKDHSEKTESVEI